MGQSRLPAPCQPSYATYVGRMQTSAGRRVFGFIELQVGSLPVKIPVRAAAQGTEGDRSLPLAQFEVEGDSCAIAVRAEPSTPGVEQAVREAAEQAVVHLSRKLLN
jgi:hypothetical protein